MSPAARSAEPEPRALICDGAPEASLVAAVLRKDRRASVEFVELYADAVYSYVASRLVPHFDKVEDVTQEIFLVAWKSLPDYRGDAPLRAWLLGIARHKVEDYYRAKLRAPEALSEDENGEPVANPQLEVDAVLDRDRIAEKVRQVLGAMREDYALLLLWKYWEKRSAREVGQQTGRSEKSVERMLARARAEFRELWSNA